MKKSGKLVTQDSQENQHQNYPLLIKKNNKEKILQFQRKSKPSPRSMTYYFFSSTYSQVPR
ncbi:hypothetical protein NIES4101_28300 (plasmid) [Calothrix sp. NIES-4101]|nr:hypothetical protein NIES4101_28300 [Calothrix sp. NIES-4101]